MMNDRFAVIFVLCTLMFGCSERSEQGSDSPGEADTAEQLPDVAQYDEATLPSLTLTPEAAEMIREIAEAESLDAFWVRVGVTSGESGFLKYILDLTQTIDKELDTFLKSEGLEIVIRQEHAVYLDGTVIRFQDDERGKGFVFDNPNAMQP